MVLQCSQIFVSLVFREAAEHLREQKRVAPRPVISFPQISQALI